MSLFTVHIVHSHETRQAARGDIFQSIRNTFRGGLAVELGPGRFDNQGARNYASEKFGGHSLGNFFVDTPPRLASKYT